VFASVPGLTRRKTKISHKKAQALTHTKNKAQFDSVLAPHKRTLVYGSSCGAASLESGNRFKKYLAKRF